MEPVDESLDGGVANVIYVMVLHIDSDLRRRSLNWAIEWLTRSDVIHVELFFPQYDSTFCLRFGAVRMLRRWIPAGRHWSVFELRLSERAYRAVWQACRSVAERQPPDDKHRQWTWCLPLWCASLADIVHFGCCCCGVCAPPGALHARCVHNRERRPTALSCSTSLVYVLQRGGMWRSYDYQKVTPDDVFRMLTASDERGSDHVRRLFLRAGTKEVWRLTRAKCSASSSPRRARSRCHDRKLGGVVSERDVEDDLELVTEQQLDELASLLADDRPLPAEGREFSAAVFLYEDGGINN